MFVTETEIRFTSDPYNVKFVTCDKSKFGKTLKFFACNNLDSSTLVIFKLSKFIGSEKEPILNVLFCFSVKFSVNSKFPCVKPPPSTNWKPTKLSENVPLPDGVCGGQVYFFNAIILLYY